MALGKWLGNDCSSDRRGDAGDGDSDEDSDGCDEDSEGKSHPSSYNRCQASVDAQLCCSLFPEVSTVWSFWATRQDNQNLSNLQKSQGGKQEHVPDLPSAFSFLGSRVKYLPDARSCRNRFAGVDHSEEL
ncbi:Dual Specificity Protein Phosphatase 9 [Manis pentadactyla]|nr:Dual Specificity Protein Phosphatase 9 [Manis pentadactyla]